MPDGQTIGDMTRDELEAFVQAIVRREAAEPRQPAGISGAARSLDEVFASIDRNLIILPLDAQSPRELLREDRQR